MEIHTGKRIAEIELISKDGNKVQLTLDGKLYDVDIVMAENGSCSILHDGKSYNAELVRSESGKQYEVNTLFSSHSVDIVDTQAKYLRMKKKEEKRQDNKIVAPMSGKIVKIPVKPGDILRPDDTAVVIEAMKMQNNYKVSSECVVSDILVAEGDTVNENQIIMMLDINVTKNEQ